MKFLVTGTYSSLKRKKTMRPCRCGKWPISKWAIVRSCRSFGQRARCLHPIWTASALQPGDQRPTVSSVFSILCCLNQCLTLHSTQCLAVTESGLLTVIRPPLFPGAQWIQCGSPFFNFCKNAVTHFSRSLSVQVLPEATMSSSCFVLGGCMQLAACTHDGVLHVSRCK